MNPTDLLSTMVKTYAGLSSYEDFGEVTNSISNLENRPDYRLLTNFHTVFSPPQIYLNWTRFERDLFDRTDPPDNLIVGTNELVLRRDERIIATKPVRYLYRILPTRISIVAQFVPSMLRSDFANLFLKSFNFDGCEGEDSVLVFGESCYRLTVLERSLEVPISLFISATSMLLRKIDYVTDAIPEETLGVTANSRFRTTILYTKLNFSPIAR